MKPLHRAHRGGPSWPKSRTGISLSCSSLGAKGLTCARNGILDATNISLERGIEFVVMRNIRGLVLPWSSTK